MTLLLAATAATAILALLVHWHDRTEPGAVYSEDDHLRVAMVRLHARSRNH